ncbi:MAG TPA: rhodanese-like domain-containing protein [Rhodocyclaceae bacterium]|jgi:rhodanese-related sulfurtransferase|nr:rhodanese-like domain-containing protein [Rhodocyclaceae bacterium]
MQQISAAQLNEWLRDESRAKPVLLDVREPWEFETCKIGGSQSLPMRSIPQRLNELDADAEIVAICHHGMRSMQVAAFLEQNGFGKLYNLQGGVAAWAAQVDPTMPTY